MLYSNPPVWEQMGSLALIDIFNLIVSTPLFQVTLIPTFDSLTMHDWYQETHERQKELAITVLGSNSTVAMQDETFPACKVEF